MGIIKPPDGLDTMSRGRNFPPITKRGKVYLDNNMIEPIEEGQNYDY